MKKYLYIGAVLLMLAGTGLWAYRALASDSAGPNGPSSASDDATVGTQTWSNPSNATISDSSCANVSFSRTSAVITHYLKATGFSFAIPSSASIDGIVAEYQAGTPDGSTASESTIKLVKGGIISGTNEASGSVGFASCNSSMSYKTVGSSSTKWGLTLVGSDINSSDFGVAFSFSETAGGDFTPQMNFNYVRITVYYTTASGQHASVTMTKGVTTLTSGTLTIP